MNRKSFPSFLIALTYTPELFTSRAAMPTKTEKNENEKKNERNFRDAQAGAKPMQRVP